MSSSSPQERGSVEASAGNRRVEVAAVLESVASRLRDSSQVALRHERLTPGGLALLVRVLERPGITTSELGALMETTRQAASKALQPLVASGLLLGIAHPQDKRSVQLQLTAAGKRAIQRGRARQATERLAVLEPLTDAEVTTLARLLERMDSRPPSDSAR
jgi:DNA-binding MarR family transcriptional regulator